MKRLIAVFVLMISLIIIIYIGVSYGEFVFSMDNITGIIITFLAAVLVFLAGGAVVLFIYRKKDNQIKFLSNRLERWSNLTVHVNKMGDEVFSELPIGIIIYDEDNEVKWVNKFANQIFSAELIDKSLSEISSILMEEINNGKSEFILELETISFDVIHRKENKLLYLFDVSKREDVLKIYKQRIPAIGIINLDNLDNETKAFDMQERINLRGQYLGEISDWATKYSGYLKSYDDGTLIIICEYSAVVKMCEDKFDILNKVREISQAHGVRVTCSIGIACHDVSYEEIGTLSQTAIDLAEKRGGDQAVVNIQHEKIQYFGASLNAIEKNTYVDARRRTAELKGIIESSSNVYIMGHTMTDTDSLGAMIGMLKICLTSPRPVNIVLDPLKLDSTTSKIYNEILLSDVSYKTNIIAFDQASVDADSLLIVVDTQSPKIVMNEQFLHKFKKLAVIDHHRTGEDVFDNPIFNYISTSASSTVELVSEMMMFYNPKAPIKLTELEATILLTGIVVDTNNFTFRCASRSFEAASRLLEQGADMIMVRKLLRNDFGIQMKLNKYVSDAKVLLEQFAVVAIEEMIEDRTLLAQVSESLLNIDGVNASFTLAPIDMPDGQAVSISARSYEHINVQIIMEELGGGGHLNSAATLIRNCTLSEAKKKLAIILKRDYEIGEQKMKIILLEDVKGRGNKNDIIDVATGFGNYLLTNKMGILATNEEIKNLEKALELEKNILEDEKKMMRRIKEEIETKVVNVHVVFGADGKPFGSITTKHISEELEAQFGIKVDKRKITLPQDINSIGMYTATISLHKEVVAQLQINVLEK